MIKKLIAVSSAVCLMLCAFSGCENQGSTSVNNTPSATQQEEVTPTAVPDDVVEKTDYVTEIWVAKEIEFVSDKVVRDITKTELDVVFTNRTSGTEMVVPGFWDGNKSWKVRFAPTEYGIWDFVTKTTGEDIGINGIKGTLASNAYKGDLAIYKHGFVKTEENLRYFVYNDGTPFFYLGDTHWTMPKEEFDSAGDYAGDIKTNSHFRYIVDRRAAQGFTVYQSEPLQSGINVSDGYISSTDITAFQKLDKYYQYIAEKGLVHANAQFFLPGESNVTKEFIENLRPLTRYWVARYSAYPVMWTLGQEVDDASNFSDEKALWQTYVDMCKIMNEVDPYKHPTSAHQVNAMVITCKGGVFTAGVDYGTSEFNPNSTAKTHITRQSKFYGVQGHTWWASQWRPTVHMQYNFDIPRDYWENGEGKPTIDYEARYHYLSASDFGARVQAWIPYLCGMYGHGYGARDMWYYGTTSYDQDANDGVGYMTAAEKAERSWSYFIDAPISTELTYLRGFFEHVGWWKLIPDFDNGNAFQKVDGKEGFYVAAHDGNDVYVVYLYNRTVDSAGKLVNMDKKATYVAQWFDTRTGKYTLIGNIKADENGEYDIPQKPVADDMVLLVTKK